MQPTKKCVFCGAVARYQRIEHVEVIGTAKVAMPSVMAYRCDSCGEVDLSLGQLTHLQLQAALTALVDLPKIDGKTFRAVRKSLGLTQSALADFMDAAPETVSRWESGSEVSRSAQLMLLSAVMLVQKGRPVVAPAAPAEPSEPLVSSEDPPLPVAC